MELTGAPGEIRFTSAIPGAHRAAALEQPGPQRGPRSTVLDLPTAARPCPHWQRTCRGARRHARITVGPKETEMIVNPVATPVETSAPSTTDAPKTKLDRAARAIRILVDTLCIALFLYCQFSRVDVMQGIVTFWMVSIVVFPY